MSRGFSYGKVAGGVYVFWWRDLAGLLSSATAVGYRLTDLFGGWPAGRGGVAGTAGGA